MPTLKQLQCTVEWSGTEAPLTEYNTRYEDGKVETHIAVPEIATPFAIRLKSMGYIASGLAMFVYIDGEYQCNRNRQNLRTPKGSSSHRRTEVNFVVRQKETALDDESFLAKPWRFEKLNIAFGDSQTFSHNIPYKGEYMGVIEVVVLRCFPKIESLSSTIPQTSRTPVQQQKTTPAKLDATTGAKGKLPTDDQEAPLIGGIFDGACGSSCHSHELMFGVDGSWEDPNPNQGASVAGQKQWGVQMTGPNTGVYQPIGPTAGQERQDRNGPLDHAKQGWLQSPKGTPQGTPHLTPREMSQTSPPFILPASPAIVINVTHGASQPPPQWIFPGDTGGSVAGSCATPSSPYEHTEPVHEMAQNRSAKDVLGGSSNRGNNVISTDSSGSAVASKPRNDWSSDQPGTQGVPGAWIDADDVGWANTGNNNEVEDWDSNNQNDNSNWENTKHVGSNNNDCWNGNDISGWPNDTKDKKDKSNNTDSWYNSNSPNLGKNDSWDNSKNSNKGNNDSWNYNKSPNQGNDDSWDNDKSPNQGGDHSWNANNRPNHAHSWVSEPAPQKNQTNDRNVIKSPNGKDGNAASIHNQTWTKQGSLHHGSPRAYEIGTLGQQSVANGHEVGDHNTPTQVSQVDFNNQMPSGSLRNGQPQFSIPSPAPPSERRDRYNSLNEPKGGQKNSGFSAKVGNTSFPDRPISKPSGLGAKPYWAPWNSSHLPESSQIGSPKYRSLRAEPTPTVAQETINRRHLSHQVRSGKPLLYLHKVASPRYMDSHKSPYAVFVFHYRSKELLEHKLSVTVTEPAVDEKERLKHVSKEEIIEQYLRAKEALSVASKTNSLAQNGFCRTPLSQQPNTGQQWGSSNLQQNLNGIGIDIGPVEERLSNMEVNDKTRGRSKSADAAFIWENNASAQTEDPLSQQGSTGDKNRTTLMSEDGHKTNRRSDPANENAASDSNNINWGGEDHNRDSSAKGSPTKTVWGGESGPNSNWKNERHSPFGGVSNDRGEDLGWENEGQANGGWDNSRAEENADVAW